MQEHEKEEQSFSPRKADARQLRGVTCRDKDVPALLPDDQIKEEASMKYYNANMILPDALVKELQTYVQGGYIYVPIEPKRQRRWGEVSGYRQELKERNRQIREAYRKGIPMERLSETYSLSLSAVRKIIYQK